MIDQTDNCYLKPNRLSDVIRLIIVLAVDTNSWRSETGLQTTLKDSPKSGETWLSVAKEHPEFFRFGKDDDAIVLLIRFIIKKDSDEGEPRKPIEVDQTQKLVDQAIALHDRQLARYQRDSSKTAVTAAWIAAGATIIAGIISLYIAVNANNDVKSELQGIQYKLEKLQQSREKK
nr:hypothetical protein [Pedobacter sp. ASV2]